MQNPELRGGCDGKLRDGPLNAEGRIQRARFLWNRVPPTSLRSAPQGLRIVENESEKNVETSETRAPNERFRQKETKETKGTKEEGLNLFVDSEGVGASIPRRAKRLHFRRSGWLWQYTPGGQYEIRSFHHRGGEWRDWPLDSAMTS